MSTLNKSILVQTPFAQAADLIERFFLASSSTEERVVTLRLAAPGAGLGFGGFELAHDVVASFRRRKGPNETIVFDIHWESADSGLYPTCDCTLTVAEDETYESCRLILEGAYTPPGWVAGAVFDAILGSRIADSTAKIGALTRDVLVTIGEPEPRSWLTRIPISWKAPESSAFPVFRGFFEVQPLSSRHVQLALLGYYHPPYGAFGAVFDAALGRKIAEITMRHLVDDVSRSITDDPVFV